MWRADIPRRTLGAMAAIYFALAGAATAQDNTGASANPPAAAQGSTAAPARQPAAAQRNAGTPGKRPVVTNSTPPSPNATTNLINLLVKQKVITAEQAAALIKQADDEAYVAREAVHNATDKAESAEKTATTAADEVSPPGTKRVTYVPEIVKQQLREEIKQEVMDKAQKEGWASPGTFPEWAQRIHLYGDVRLRYEGDYFPPGNGAVENFNAINTGSPFLIADDTGTPNPYFPPSYNTIEDRNRFRFRARLGLDADLFDGFTAGLRIATGENNSPISTNQTFGASGGNFSKYAVWLDRAFIHYQPIPQLGAWAGRFDNPFWRPTDLVWYDELGFDGFALTAERDNPDFAPFVVAGGFPIFNTDPNATINTADLSIPAPLPSPSEDKWLFGVQGGFGARLDPETSIKLAAAYFDFTNVQGELSSSCFVVTAVDGCNTDLLRPSFAQKGNTYMQLRNIPFILDETSDYQFYGLASKFRPLVGSGEIDFAQFNPVHVTLDGDFVWNTAFNRAAIAAIAVNNFAPDVASGVTGPFNGGSMGWLGKLTVGDKEIKQLWDWNAFAGYKYLESDAMVDAFVDSDFGLGGTNLKGYFIGANLGLSHDVWMRARWMSANAIAGQPYAVDIFQLDLNAKF